MDPPKSGVPLDSGQINCPWFYHTSIPFWTSEKQTPLNSKQRTLISPWCTLANTKLLPKMGYSHIVNSHFVNSHFVNSHFRNWRSGKIPRKRTVKLHSPNATSSCLTYSGGRVHNSMPTRSILNVDISVFWTCNGCSLNCTSKSKFSVTNECFFGYDVVIA